MWATEIRRQRIFSSREDGCQVGPAHWRKPRNTRFKAANDSLVGAVISMPMIVRVAGHSDIHH